MCLYLHTFFIKYSMGYDLEIQLCKGLWKMIDFSDYSNPLDHSPEPFIASDYVRV